MRILFFLFVLFSMGVAGGGATHAGSAFSNKAALDELFQKTIKKCVADEYKKRNYKIRFSRYSTISSCTFLFSHECILNSEMFPDLSKWECYDLESQYWQKLSEKSKNALAALLTKYKNYDGKKGLINAIEAYESKGNWQCKYEIAQWHHKSIKLLISYYCAVNYEAELAVTITYWYRDYKKRKGE